MLRGYKTITFNLLVAVVPIMELTEMKAIIPDDYLSVYLLCVAIGNVYLRSITTTPVGKRA